MTQPQKTLLQNVGMWALLLALGAAAGLIFDSTTRVSSSAYAADKTKIESRIDKHDDEIRALQLDIAGRLSRIETSLTNLERQHGQNAVR